MSIWKHQANPEALNSMHAGTMLEHLDIRVEEIGEDFIKASMPVDERTFQPARLLHGGASVVLAESLGSVASALCIQDITEYHPVGVEINANHIRSATSGRVTGIVKPIKIGRKMHFWQIDIFREDGKQICSSRLTVAVVEHPGKRKT